MCGEFEHWSLAFDLQNPESMQLFLMCFLNGGAGSDVDCGAHTATIRVPARNFLFLLLEVLSGEMCVWFVWQNNLLVLMKLG